MNIGTTSQVKPLPLTATLDSLVVKVDKMVVVAVVLSPRQRAAREQSHVQALSTIGHHHHHRNYRSSGILALARVLAPSLLDQYLAPATTPKAQYATTTTGNC